MRRAHAWTPEEDAMLRLFWGRATSFQIAECFGLSPSAVQNRARTLRLDAGRFWTDEQDAELRRLYPNHTAEAIAAQIGRPLSSVRQRAHTLGLRKSRGWIAEQSRIRTADPNHPGRNTRFRSGRRTWNKGMKGLNLGGTATQFKPGHRPHTWRPIGTYRVSKDGYLQSKLADTGNTLRDYVFVHHLIWRMHGGRIPRGHALVFRDGDKANLDINNLELITRAELMARNTRHRLPPELNRVIALRAALNRRINNLERRAA